ncbi:MAG: TonB-dependent receptor, partial [Lewinella sp.]
MKAKNALLLLIILTGLPLASQTYTLSGTVTSDGDPVAYATVWLESLDRGTSAGADGRFEIADLEPGDYQIVFSAVGFRPNQREVSVVDRDVTFGVQLTEGSDLSQIEVFGARFQHPDKIEALTRLPLETYEQIQSISVISEKVIEQQGALTISDAVKNVPGVYTFATYGNRTESISSRGFRGIPMLKNGVRVHSDFRGQGFLTDMQGVDNIQVLKGAASITQGVATDLGSPGGVVNIVTKTPRYDFGGQATLRAGSFGQARLTFDTYGPLNEAKNLAFRVNAAVERADSYREGISSQRFYINPSLEYRIDPKSALTLEMEYFDDSRTPDVGTVNLGENDVNAIYDLPYDQFLGFDHDRNVTRTVNYSLRFNRELTDRLSIRAAYFNSKLDFNGKGASLGSAIEDATGTTRYNLRTRGYSLSSREDRTSVVQLDLLGRDVQTGNITHTFQVGTDYRTTDF